MMTEFTIISLFIFFFQPFRIIPFYSRDQCQIFSYNKYKNSCQLFIGFWEDVDFEDSFVCLHGTDYDNVFCALPQFELIQKKHAKIRKSVKKFFSITNSMKIFVKRYKSKMCPRSERAEEKNRRYTI